MRKTKKFDCVEMKRQAQERLQQEFEARKSEFSSHLDFIKKKAGESRLNSPLIKPVVARTSELDLPAAPGIESSAAQAGAGKARD